MVMKHIMVHLQVEYLMEFTNSAHIAKNKNANQSGSGFLTLKNQILVKPIQYLPSC